jgi:hypothetical protein
LNKLEETREKNREYYHANKDKIREQINKRRVEKNGSIKPTGRPRKYNIDT